MPEAQTKDMRPRFEEIQAHYDLSDEFFGLFQDSTRKYSSAYFTGPNVTLSEAQVANVDLHLDKLDLKPGMTLLEIGCGWGLTLQRAMEKYDVNVIGLTLSRNQQNYCRELLGKVDSERTFDVRLEGWEQFHSPVDRIVSIEAFEHFGFERYDDFFKTCYEILPADGRMTIQSSVGYHPFDLAARGKKLTFELARFAKFIYTEIFPGRPDTQHPDDGRARRKGRLRGARDHVATNPLHQDPGYVGGRPGAQQGAGDRHHRRGELPPVHEVPDRLPVLLRRREPRRQPGDIPQGSPGGLANRYCLRAHVHSYRKHRHRTVQKLRQEVDTPPGRWDDLLSSISDSSKLYR